MPSILHEGVAVPSLYYFLSEASPRQFTCAALGSLSPCNFSKPRQGGSSNIFVLGLGLMDSGQLDTIIVNIFSEVRGAPTTMADANKMLGSSSTVLAVFGRAGDSLRGMYGKKSKFERDQLLQAMDLLIARIGHQVSGAAPQVSVFGCILYECITLSTFADHDNFANILQRPRNTP